MTCPTCRVCFGRGLVGDGKTACSRCATGPCDCINCDPLTDSPRDRLAALIQAHLAERWPYIDIRQGPEDEEDWRELCRDAADAVVGQFESGACNISQSSSTDQT